MADFPALIPSARTWTVGRVPVAQYVAANGPRAMARLGIGSHDHELRLSFSGLAIASAALIRTHWRNVGGTAETFDLPAAVWSAGAFSVPLLSGLQWRYDEPPSFEDDGCGLQNVDVRLTTAPWAMTYKGTEYSLGSLLDVGLGAPVAGQQLTYNGSCWIAY